jgi:hypothetical protein
MDWIITAMGLASPVIWYFIGRHDGYAKGAADKRRQIVNGMDNLLAADVIRVQIRRDAVVDLDPPGPEAWLKIDGMHIASASETKH